MERSGESEWPAASVVPDEESASGGRVLVPVAGGTSERAVTIAADLASGSGGELLALDVATGEVETVSPEADGTLDGRVAGFDGIGTGAAGGEDADASGGRGSSPPDDATGDGEAADDEGGDGETGDDAAGDGEGTTGLPGGTASVVVDAVADNDVDALVVEDNGSGGRLRGSTAARIARRVDCHALRVGENNATPSVASVLVPVSRGPHAAAAVATAAAVAAENDAWIELLHVLEDDDPSTRTTAKVLLERLEASVAGDVEVQTWLLEEGAVRESIVEQTAHYDVTILGASERSRLRRLLFGSRSQSVLEGGENTVAVAHADGGWPFDE